MGTLENIEKVKREINTAFAEAPFLVRKNKQFKQACGISSQLISIVEDQQNQIEALKENQYSRD